MCSTLKYAQGELLLSRNPVVGSYHSCWYVFIVLRSAGQPHHHKETYQLIMKVEHGANKDASGTTMAKLCSTILH